MQVRWEHSGRYADNARSGPMRFLAVSPPVNFTRASKKHVSLLTLRFWWLMCVVIEFPHNETEHVSRNADS